LSRCSRIHIEKINGPFLFQFKGTPAECKAGLERAIANGWLWLHESGTFAGNAGLVPPRLLTTAPRLAWCTVRPNHLGCPCRKFNPLAVDREARDAAARCWICAN
jgi:hypothetical protein